MRAISLWQPWASLWLTPSKIHETRHWPTPYRGTLWVHASKRLVRDPGGAVDVICTQHFGIDWRDTLPRGALIGSVQLIDCLATDSMSYQELEPHQQPDDLWCGDFSPGRFAWKRAACMVLGKPIPLVGRQGFFTVPDEVLEHG